MTNGNTATLFVLGGAQNDNFEVNHNRGMVYLHGGAGDDRFLLKTFLVLKENPDKPDLVTNLMTLFGGTGMNRYEYVQNAPVDINGGPGIDTIVVIGTPIGDNFVVTDTYIAGAGRIVTFKNVEPIEVDGGGGPDEIWILATNPNLVTVIDGGSGDDIIHIGGTPPILVFDDPPQTYVPPPFIIPLPPIVQYTHYKYDLTNYTFTINIFDYLARGGNPQTVAQSLVASLVANVNALLSFIPLASFSAQIIDPGNGIPIALLRDRYDFFFWWFNPYIDITIPHLQVDYTFGHLVPNSKKIQPPPVTVDPPPFAFTAPPSLDANEVKGQVIIKGGNQFESAGDTVVYENRDGSAAADGQLVWRTVPRMVGKIGQQPARPATRSSSRTSTRTAACCSPTPT